MLRDPGDSTGIIDFFSKHLVPIYLLFQDKSGKIHQSVLTAFVMSIENVWFLMTAGHCIEDVETNVARGATIKSALLLDALRTSAPHKMPIPFDYASSGAAKICYDPKYDYGGIVIDTHYRRLLEANGIQAITEQAWERQPREFDFFKVMGVNHAKTQFEQGKAFITLTSHRVRRLRRRPKGFEKTKAPTLWGKVSLDRSGTPIDGLSGGPVFGFVKRGQELKYWLYAVQSRWLVKERQIAACEMRPLGAFLKDFMHGKHPHLSEPPDIQIKATGIVDAAQG